MRNKVQCQRTISKQERDLVVSMIKQCFKVIAKKKYEFKDRNGNSLTMAGMWKALPLVRIGSYKGSCAGAEQIKIGMLTQFGTRVTEYKSFANDPVIGNIQMNRQEDALRCLVAHEVAHHIQYRYGRHTDWLKSKYRKPHGEGFREIYAILRGELINHLAQEETKLAASKG